jgi:hypothetical protein
MHFDIFFSSHSLLRPHLDRRLPPNPLQAGGNVPRPLVCHGRHFLSATFLPELQTDFIERAKS